MSHGKDFAQKLNVLGGILPEDVLESHNRLLDYQRVLELHGLDQSIDTFVRRALQFDAQSSNCSDAKSNELDVDLLNVFLKLNQNLVNCVLVSQCSQNSQFFLFNKKRVLVGTEEKFKKSFENVRLGFSQMTDTFKSNKSDLFFLMIKRRQSLSNSISN